jgi:hypothetical protein
MTTLSSINCAGLVVSFIVRDEVASSDPLIFTWFWNWSSMFKTYVKILRSVIPGLMAVCMYFFGCGIMATANHFHLLKAQSSSTC